MRNARCVNLSKLLVVLSFLVLSFTLPRPSRAQDTGEPTIEELRLRLAQYYVNEFGGKFKLDGLSQAEISQIACGSYLVSGAGLCHLCHTTSAGYLAGGFEFDLPFADVHGFTSVFTSNLTPDPETGLSLTEEEFIESMCTGKDFTNSTDAEPQRFLVHPWAVHRFMSLDDLKAIYAFLRRIPPVRNNLRRTFKTPFP